MKKINSPKDFGKHFNKFLEDEAFVGVKKSELMDLVNKASRLEDENEKLKEQLEKSEAQNYCKICGNTIDGYKPTGAKVYIVRCFIDCYDDSWHIDSIYWNIEDADKRMNKLDKVEDHSALVEEMEVL